VCSCSWSMADFSPGVARWAALDGFPSAACRLVSTPARGSCQGVAVTDEVGLTRVAGVLGGDSRSVGEGLDDERATRAKRAWSARSRPTRSPTVFRSARDRRTRRLDRSLHELLPLVHVAVSLLLRVEPCSVCAWWTSAFRVGLSPRPPGRSSRRGTTSSPGRRSLLMREPGAPWHLNPVFELLRPFPLAAFGLPRVSGPSGVPEKHVRNGAETIGRCPDAGR